MVRTLDDIGERTATIIISGEDDEGRVIGVNTVENLLFSATGILVVASRGDAVISIGKLSLSSSTSDFLNLSITSNLAKGSSQSTSLPVSSFHKKKSKYGSIKLSSMSDIAGV